MFKEEAQWLEKTISKISPLPGNNKAANLGSSTADFRKNVQPHIQKHLIVPLEKRGWQVLHIDMKHEAGVDVEADVTEAFFGRKFFSCFALTVCTNMLEHVENIPLLIKNLLCVTTKSGYILITVPNKYKKHLDPIDNMFRPKPAEIAALFPKNSVSIIAEQIIRIDDLNYYSKKKSRFPLWGYRERIKYYLGIRHKVAGVLLKVIQEK